MARSAARTIFGVHEFTARNRSTKEFYGSSKILGSSSLTLSGELVELRGGSSRYPWDVQDGNIDAELSLTFREYPDFLFQLFLGKAPSELTAAPTAGAVTTLTNGYGTTCKSATIGIASVGLKSGASADLKFGKYVVKVISATTVHVYASTDIDFQRGTDKEYQDDNGKVTATALTITTGAVAVEVPGFGIELIGGSGTIGMTIGDTAIFEVLPPYSASMEVNIGSTSDVFPEFGAIMIAQQKGSGEMFDIEAYRVKVLGLPIGLNEKEFSEAEVTGKVFYDSAENKILRIRHVTPV